METGRLLEAGRLLESLRHTYIHIYICGSIYIYMDPQWSKKWLEEGQISEDGKAKPGKASGTIKTHKEGNPLRLIRDLKIRRRGEAGRLPEVNSHRTHAHEYSELT